MKKKKNLKVSCPIIEKDNLESYYPKKKKNYFWAEIEKENEIEEESPFKFLFIAFALCLFSAGGWFAYHSFFSSSSDVIPVLTPQSQIYRLEPEDKGGIAVPYQDKMICNQDKNQGERVMQPQEFYYSQRQEIKKQEISREDEIKKYPPPSQELSNHQELIKEDQNSIVKDQKNTKKFRTLEPMLYNASLEDKNIQEIQDNQKSKNISQEKESKENQKTENDLVASIEEDVFQIQVGSFKSSKTAARELSRLKKRHTRLLSDYDCEIQNLKKGRVRILIGPFYSRTQALSIAMRLGHRSRVIKEQ